MLGFDRLLAQPRFSAHDEISISGILDLAQAIAQRELLPCAAELDAREPQFVDGQIKVPDATKRAVEACSSAGFFAAGFDVEDGGLQLPFTVGVLLNGILAGANIAVANYQFLTVANANMLRAFGTTEQKAMFLPPMLEGRWLGTMCLSETQAGSSLADIATRAEPIDRRTHRITGSKMWISGGDHDISENIVHMVLAKRPDGPPGVKGISLFIVPKYRVKPDGSPGDFNNVTAAGLNHKMGQRGTTNCLLNFGEAGETHGYLVGDAHRGLSYMFHMMNEARVIVGSNAAMLGLAGYLYSLYYAKTRLQGRPNGNKDPLAPQVAIIEHADVRRMLLAQKSTVEGGIALALYSTMLVDRISVAVDEVEREELRLQLELLTPITKSWPSEHCLEANKLAIQVLGGYGYTRDYPVERLYRDNRLNHIHEGTWAIHGLDLLGRKVAMEDGRALHLLLREIEATVQCALDCAAFDGEAETLGKAVVALKDATNAVLGCSDAQLRLANATTYLDAFGHVVVGWLWLQQALVASSALAAGSSDVAFYTGKLRAARYFYRYELPGVFEKFALIASLDDTFVTMHPDEFAGS